MLNSLGRLVTKVHVTMGIRQGSVEGPLCFILLYALSITQAQKKRPQHQRVIAVVPRGNTVSRLDLSDLCFVDHLVSLLMFWRKSQLSRFAEMVSQVLESGRLRVNKSKLEVLIGVAGKGARRINAEIACGAYQSGGIPGKYASRGADEGYQGHQGPGSIFSWTVGSSFSWLEHQNQAVVDAGSEHLLYVAEARSWLPRDVETLEKWQNSAL